ncbi:MAG: VCBS repeat-containing protein [Pirellulaceae bacterium]
MPELPNPTSVTASDIDNDGDLDVLAVSPALRQVVMFENTDANGEFAQMNVLAEAPSDISQAVPADFDADGDVDLIVFSNNAHGSVGWFENINGLGAFGDFRELIADTGFDSVAVGDIDGDGWNDLVTLRRDSESFGCYGLVEE